MADDWRLHGQDNLHGVTLHRRQYFLWRPDWDHDHCEFCWKSFELPGAPERPNQVTEGWTTDDEYSWICDGCFNDFEMRFSWNLRDRLPSDHQDTPLPQGTVQPKSTIEK